MKRCPACGLTKPLADFHRSRRRADGRQSQCKPCHGQATAAAKRANPAAEAATQARYRVRLAARVAEGYGGVCACCGESEPAFLTVDHVNGREPDDAERGYQLYMRIIREGFPSTYRLLCWNCNCGRERNGGVCPHEMARVIV